MSLRSKLKVHLFPGPGIKSAIEKQTKVLKQIDHKLKQSNSLALSMLRAQTHDLMVEIDAWHKDHQYNLLDSIKAIKNERLSFARFGDGEIRMMFSDSFNIPFQSNSPQLQTALLDVIEYAKKSPHKLLIGLNKPWVGPSAYWLDFYLQTWENTKSLFDGLERIGSANATRTLSFGDYPGHGLQAWREVWDGLNVTFVTGQGSRFELEPALFDNIAKHTMVYSTPTNAFADLERLVGELSISESELILIALGPSGTILTSKLAKAGKWAIDIGHLPNVYQLEYSGGKIPEKLPVTRNNVL